MRSSRRIYHPIWCVCPMTILAIAVAQLPPPIIAIGPQLNIGYYRFFSFCPHCWLCLGGHTQPGERSLLLSRLPGWGRVYVSWEAVHPQCMLCLPWGGAWYQVFVGEGEGLWSGLKPGDRCPFSRIPVFQGHSGSRVWGGRGYVPSSPAAASPCHSAMLSMYLWNSSTFGFSSPSLNFLFTPHTSICSFCALTFLMSCTR